MAIRLFRGDRQQFLWILAVGTAAVIAGSGLSYVLDLPTGAAIVCTFGMGLGVQILVEGLVRR
jgi:ABC-type Mn2+/Zn2+ transport system permease subunit